MIVHVQPHIVLIHDQDALSVQKWYGVIPIVHMQYQDSEGCMCTSVAKCRCAFHTYVRTDTEHCA